MEHKYPFERRLSQALRAEPTTAFGAVFDALVVEKKLTAADVAQRSGISHATISRARTGQRALSKMMVKQIAAGFFPLSDDERDMLYVSAGHVPPGWQIPMLRRLMKETGINVEVRT